MRQKRLRTTVLKNVTTGGSHSTFKRLISYEPLLLSLSSILTELGSVLFSPATKNFKGFNVPSSVRANELDVGHE